MQKFERKKAAKQVSNGFVANFSIFQFFNFSAFKPPAAVDWRLDFDILIFFGCKMVVFIEKNDDDYYYNTTPDQWSSNEEHF